MDNDYAYYLALLIRIITAIIVIIIKYFYHFSAF